MQGDETKRKSDLVSISGRGSLTNDWKAEPPERAQKEAQKEADVWPKILISWQWTDDGQTIMGLRGS
jgi:hypothetical protein